MSDLPPLSPLHSARSLSQPRISVFEKLSTERLKQTLLPGQEHSLKTRPDGTILDGHHRVHVLNNRGVDTNALPREVIERDDAD